MRPKWSPLAVVVALAVTTACRAPEPEVSAPDAGAGDAASELSESDASDAHQDQTSDQSFDLLPDVDDARATPGCSLPGAAFEGAHEIVVAGKPRAFTIRLPAGYDPARPYPLVFGLHGAGGNGPSFGAYFPLVRGMEDAAIFVFPSALFYELDGRTTWRYPTEENVAFFDALVETITANLCVDRARIFASGFSSGGFYSNTLGCRRGDVLRAIVPVAGGDRDFSDAEGNDLCAGHVAVMVISSPLDSTDPTGGPPGISHHQRGIRARDYFRVRNGCLDETDPSGDAGCVQYRGCMPDAEVVYCEHGQGHAWPLELQAEASRFVTRYR
jgi:poly(3-hydroxybutyrate) depolymerase